jgi:hypothetical protein
MTKPRLITLILLSLFTKSIVYANEPGEKPVVKEKAKEDKTDNQTAIYKPAAKKYFGIQRSESGIRPYERWNLRTAGVIITVVL